MRLFRLFMAFAMALRAGNDTVVHRLWEGLSAQRAKLSSIHEEFAVTQTYKATHGDRSSKRQIILDLNGDKWREKSVSGSGSFVRIFDGQDLLRMEEGGDEYIRVKRKPKED